LAAFQVSYQGIGIVRHKAETGGVDLYEVTSIVERSGVAARERAGQ
jgi:hypothetical protein